MNEQGIFDVAGNTASVIFDDHMFEESTKRAKQLNLSLPENGFAIQRIYTRDTDLDVAIPVQHGDVVLIHEGYHPGRERSLLRLG